MSTKAPLELVTALDDASNALCRIADAAELCRNVHPDQKFVTQADDAVNLVASYMGEVNLDAEMYEGMRRAERSSEFGDMPLEDRTVLRHMRVSMEHEGIHLDADEKAECLQLLEKEQTLSFGIVQRQEQLRRGDPSSSSTWVPVESVQDALGSQVSRLERRRGTVDEVRIPSDPFWTEQVLKNSICSNARQAVFEAAHAADGEGEQVMVELLRVRQRLASLRGYSDWNEYAQRESLLQNPENVSHFLGAAWERLRPGLEDDLLRLAQEKEKLGLGVPVLEPWDMPMLLQVCKQKEVNAQAGMHVSEYLTYGSLMRGVELILSQLLGLSFTVENPEPGEVWHPSVQKYTLREGDKVLGVLYLDPFMRDGKVVQSAQFTLQGSKKLSDGVQQTPVTCLVYALPPGNMGLPLSYAVTFMHEIGHALHSLLSETSLQHLSGTRGTVDFVEFPSHLFEHFVLDPQCLALYASHAQTRAPMPVSLQETHRKTVSNFAHFEAVQQLMYAAIDQAFYSCSPKADWSEEHARLEVQQHLSSALARFDNDLHGPFNGPFSGLLGLSRISRFDHLVHYGGSYYCYLFNRALSAHVWRHGFKASPFGTEPGERLRDFFRGGSVVQSLAPIEALCPGAGGFAAQDVPLDAFVTQLSPPSRWAQ